MAQRLTVLLASNSAAKLRELRALLSELPIELVAQGEVLRPLPSVGGGSSLAGDALEKGRAAFEASTLLTLADASGLEVDALGGRPGVRSAHFAHDHATDAENNAALLGALAEVSAPARSARFRCCLALFDPWAAPEATPTVAEGVCEGEIAAGSRGVDGFGYDSLFLVRGQGGRTMAELSDAERSYHSHRAAAVRALLPALRVAVLAKLHDVVHVGGRTPSILLTYPQGR